MAEKVNKCDGLVESLLKGMDTALSTKTVVGQPTQIGDVIIVPLVDVSFGFAAGSGCNDEKGKASAGGGLGGIPAVNQVELAVVHAECVKLNGGGERVVGGPAGDAAKSCAVLHERRVYPHGLESSRRGSGGAGCIYRLGIQFMLVGEPVHGVGKDDMFLVLAFKGKVVPVRMIAVVHLF